MALPIGLPKHGLVVAAAAGVVVACLLRRRKRAMSLSNWRITVDVGRGGDADAYYVESVDDPRVRFRGPDASNRGIHGIPHPPFITNPNWDALRATPGLLRSGDVVVASFPKTGTTLTEQIVLLLLAGGDASKLDPSTQNEWSDDRGHGKYWVEKVVARGGGGGGGAASSKERRMALETFDALPAPRVVKTHAPYSIFLGADVRTGDLLPGVKVVYVTRDARDACVSAYYHAANPQKLGWPFEAWATAWASGLFEHGTIWDHRRSWRTQRAKTPDQVLWLRYEDVLAEPRREIARVAAFLGVDATPELVERTHEASTFAAMKRTAGKMSSFYRKGEAGDSKGHFDATLDADFQAIEAREAPGGAR